MEGFPQNSREIVQIVSGQNVGSMYVKRLDPYFPLIYKWKQGENKLGRASRARKNLGEGHSLANGEGRKMEFAVSMSGPEKGVITKGVSFYWRNL